MEALNYIAQVSLYWLLLYACYWLLLRKHTFFRWNRVYLLGSLLAAFVLPLIQYPEAAPPLPAAVYEVSPLPPAVPGEVTATSVAPQTPPSAVLDWMDVLWALYAVGVLVMAIRLFRHLRSLFLYIRQGAPIHMDNYTLVLSTTNSVGSFSFMKWVIINRSDYEHHFDTILTHELVHVQQRHSMDILLVEVLRVLFWFNPILILYKRSLQQVHEYLADQQAPNRDRYASFLVAYSLNTPVTVLTNHFFNSSLLKDRIQMLYKNRNSPWSLGKYLTILPLIGLVLMLSAAHERLSNSFEEGSSPIILSETPAGIPLPKPENTLPLILEQEEKTTIRGTVLNAQTNQPLRGAFVARGTSGIPTNVEGQFKLEEVLIPSTLTISHVGYKTIQVQVTKKNQVLRVTLKQKEQPLNEIVVTTYPTTKPYNPIHSNREGIPELVEQMPEFPGGVQEMYKYLAQNIRYPAEAKEKRVQGKVLVSFVVGERGAIRNPKITKGLGAGIDEEALRVVLNMPAWKPAKQNLQPVPIVYTLPIQFTIEEDEIQEDKEKRQGSTKAINYKLDDAVDFVLPTRLPDNIPIGLSPIHTSRSSSTLIETKPENLKND